MMYMFSVGKSMFFDTAIVTVLGNPSFRSDFPCRKTLFLLYFHELRSDSNQVSSVIPIGQRAAKAVREKTLSELVVFCGAAPPVFLMYVSFHSHSKFYYIKDRTRTRKISFPWYRETLRYMVQSMYHDAL